VPLEVVFRGRLRTGDAKLSLPAALDPRVGASQANLALRDAADVDSFPEPVPLSQAASFGPKGVAVTTRTNASIAGEIRDPAAGGRSKRSRNGQWRAMAEHLERAELVRLTAQRVSRDEQTVAEIVDAILEEVYEALKRGQSVSLRGFGAFYVRPEWQNWVFRFNPSQRLRALFGWSSTYPGPL
jgi:DNA-binding protein HU-beta